MTEEISKTTLTHLLRIAYAKGKTFGLRTAGCVMEGKDEPTDVTEREVDGLVRTVFFIEEIK